MAITIQADAFRSAASAASNTQSFTCTVAPNSLLVVWAIDRVDQTNSQISSVTYNGVSMTEAIDLGSGVRTDFGHSAKMFILYGPASGANDLVVNYSTNQVTEYIIVQYGGVKQSNFGSNVNSFTVVNSTSISRSLTPNGTNSWIITPAILNRAYSSSTNYTRRGAAASNMQYGDTNAVVSGSTTVSITQAQSNTMGCALLELEEAAADPVSVKTGTYTGDGATTKAITGVGFQPKALVIMATTGTGDASAAMYKTADMSTGASGFTSVIGENSGLTTGQIDSLNSDGFTVRDQKNLNGTAYYYIAFGGSNCVTGTYTGDGNDNRAITGVGFRPKFVTTQGGNNHAWFKTTTSGDSTDTSTPFSTNSAAAANYIQSLDTDGFTIGNAAAGVNVNGTTYYYFCLTGTNVTSGTYTGNGTDNRSITGVGFNPTSILIKNTGTDQAGWRTAETGDLTSRVRANLAPIANLIQSEDTNGFTIGTDAIVNTNAATYYYAAFEDAVQAAAGPTGVKTWNGVTQSTSIKTYFDVALANVKSVLGIT